MTLNNGNRQSQRLFVIKIKDKKSRKKTILRLLYDEREAYSFGYTEVISVVPLFSDNIGTAESIMQEKDEEEDIDGGNT
jgi:hypothetical protein